MRENSKPLRNFNYKQRNNIRDSVRRRHLVRPSPKEVPAGKSKNEGPTPQVRGGKGKHAE